MFRSLQPRQGRNTGRRVGTVRVATVRDGETEATRAVTGRLTQTWGGYGRVGTMLWVGAREDRAVITRG